MTNAVFLEEEIKVLGRAHPGPQSALLACPVEDVFYGGARGGGKTYGLILDWLAHAQRWGGHARGILFRRSYPELEEVEVTCQELLPLLGWVWRATKRTWFGPNGAWLRLRYLDRDDDADNYQGHSYTWMAFDEAGNWPSPVPIDKLWACLRSPFGVPVSRRLTGNPGGPGHNWLKMRYIDPAAPFTVHEQVVKAGASKVIIHSVFIPAKLEDNPTLMKNDPGYEDRLVAAAGGAEWLVKAWRLGLWDIIAGGMFDDVWDRDVHVLYPFPFPPSWRIDRSFDWGSARPFSVGWWAEADGTDWDQQDRHYPRGSLIRIQEWYGWQEGRPNEGIRLDSAEIGRGIVEREKEWGLEGKVRKGPADPSIFTKEDGPSIADNMAKATNGRVQWVKGVNVPGSRKNRWQRMRTMMKAAKEKRAEDPCLFIFTHCTQWLRTVPVAQRDKVKVDDIDTDSEDHTADETGYRVMETGGRWKITKQAV